MATSSTGTSSGASKMFLLAAVALGVLATVLAFAFINSAGNTAAVGPKLSIVVARRDLPADSVLDADRDLRTEEIPDRADFKAFSRLTLDPQILASYKGQHVNRLVPAGQPVFLADIAAYGALELKEPYRALPIQAEPGIAIPGDYVQVLITKPDLAASAEIPGRNPFVAAYAANGQAFRVIAIGGALFKTRSGVFASDAGMARSGSTVVTLEVTENQAAEIISAVGSGGQRATLVICPPPATGPAPRG